MNESSQRRPVALVTGASAGIGREYARRLGRSGYDLVVTWRRQDRLDKLANELTDASVQVVAADLGTDQGLAAVADIAGSLELDLLVNNAGLAHYMPFANLPPEKAQELVRVNVLALTMLTNAVIPGMIARGSGAVVNFASLLAFSGNADFPIPRAVYAASKAFVVSFTQLLANELKDTGVRIQVVCPGVIRTEFHDRQGLDMSGRPRMEPGDVVTASLAALETGELVCVPGLEDPAVVAAIDRAMGAILPASQQSELARRYR